MGKLTLSLQQSCPYGQGCCSDLPLLRPSLWVNSQSDNVSSLWVVLLSGGQAHAAILMGEFAILQRVILMGGPVVGWASLLSHYDKAVLMGKAVVVISHCCGHPYG